MIEVEANTILEALENAKNDLQTENIIYKKEESSNEKLVKIKAISYQNLIKEIENFLGDIADYLNILVNFETNIREENINITMYSNNNSILIGKNGQTLKALEVLIKNKIKIEWGIYPKLTLDVENYKEKRIEYLERLAIKIAKEVRTSKVDAQLENMNSFERRVIHNKLSNFKGVATESVGEEPQRHIIIKSVD